MFAKSAVSFAKPIRATMSRRTVVSNAGLPGFLYNSVWAKSTARYVSTVIIGLVAADYVFHQFFESLWDASNKGKLYKDIDWTKFKGEDEDEDEDDE